MRQNMNSETHYIIFSAYYKYGETDTKIIVGEKKFRKYAIEHYRENHLSMRICTRYDFEQFLLHHDVTYFDEEDRPMFEKIISEYKTNPDKYSAGSYTCHPEDNPEKYNPPKIDTDFRFYYIRDRRMYRFVEERAQFYVRFETKETSEITRYMTECGYAAIRNQTGWGWCDVMTVTGSDIRIKHD
uniref:Uncharacterized protein n=1 Tax=Pithovirus LCPAC401 TaxID=2506595 RepID=A0A481ZCZ4_9VIRU|nr:MAG: uncharacterized protein LCPAC401_01790 [Pithovirus LCPAC401]